MTQATLDNTINKVAPYEDLLQHVVDFIFKKHHETHPDYSNLVVLLPHAQLIPHFNLTLCNQLNNISTAIIPPYAGTLKMWAQQFADYTSNKEIVSESARQLLFIEALQQHPDLFKEENKWQVTQALFKLFDELSLNQIDLFTSEEAWRQRLQQGYGIDQQHEHLLDESHMVYTLWHAWQQQLSENNLLDEVNDYLIRLIQCAEQLDAKTHFICIGYSNYNKTEQNFIQHLHTQQRCQIFDYASTLDSDVSSAHAFASFINETFQQSSFGIKQRADNYAKNHKTPPPYSVYLASNEEQQVRAIDYQIRQHLLDGKNSIAIISEDRKLSRRLRALLERSNIQLKDNAGWSLATTQASTIIERWLECIEEDFNAFPLLDCLKSPFIDITGNVLNKNETTDDFVKNVYRFEHDLIFYENISSNIESYKMQLQRRLKRLQHWPKNTYDTLIKTLNFIDETANPLTTLYTADKKLKLSVFLKSLINSLERLGVLNRYKDDAAGQVILNTFEALQQSTLYADPLLSWYDCRVWLGLTLENQHFSLLTDDDSVQILTLNQADYQQFDCVIFAATESQHFPGSAASTPFFNQAVRTSLQLETWDEQYKNRLESFNRTLLSANEIIFTACSEEKGEEKPVSSWLELLINFYELAYGYKPVNRTLQQLATSQNEIINCDEATTPDISQQPRPQIPDDLLPKKLSASAYQRLINCPYQYFSADALSLKPLEELRDELNKANYGERIHTILQTFHSGHKFYGSAFNKTINANNRIAAEAYLNTVSEKVFLSDMENNVLHKSWLFRWQKHIPSYIDWQIKHQQDWTFHLSEEHKEVELDIDETNRLTVYGRLDRIDKTTDGHNHVIIDYKTGQSAAQEDVDIGENVQLSTYAILDPDATEVRYLSIDSSDRRIETKSSLCDEELIENREASKKRIRTLFSEMRSHSELHAWGDINVCNYCNFSGLCRKQAWSKE